MRLFVLAPLALAGCMEVAPGISATEPQVIDFNGSTVKIRHHAFAVGNAQESPIVIKANSICGGVGKKATFGSFTRLDSNQGLHTYICV